MASHKYFLSRIIETSDHFLILIVQRREHIRATCKRKIKPLQIMCLGDCFSYSLYRTSLQGVGVEVAVGVAVDVLVAVLVEVLVEVEVDVEVGVLVGVGNGATPGRTI
jgi:hypothetical protein